MANKWKIKKASDDRIIIPNSSVELYCHISQSIDDNSINARLQGALIGGANNNAYTFDPDNEYTYPEKDAPIINTYKLQEDVMYELTPYIEALGEKFNVILRRKGFIKK